MKKILFLLFLGMSLVLPTQYQAQKKTKTSTVKPSASNREMIDLTSLIQLSINETTVDLNDYFSLPGEIHIKKIPEGLTYSFENRILTLKGKMKNTIDVLIVSKTGQDFVIPVRNTNRERYTFTFVPDKKYDNIKIKGNFNGWDLNANPMILQNGKYSFDVFLNPGNYEYVFVDNGQEFPDPSNPSKVSNGIGGWNSTFTVGDLKTENPFITTQSSSSQNNNTIELKTPKQVHLICLWENTLTTAKTTDKTTYVIIPKEAKKEKRSHLRIYGYADNGKVSNDILIPLEYGKPIVNPKELNRKDAQAMVMYSLMTDRFYDGNKNNNHPLQDSEVLPAVNYQGGDFAGITQKIKSGFFDKLGINTLWISPVNQNPLEAYGFYQHGDIKTKFSGYHGYWPISSSKVDFRFGTEKELKELIATAHQHNINILLDYVANHVHIKHPLLKQHPDWITPLMLPDGRKNLRLWDEQRLTTWFDEHIPTLNLERNDTRNAMTDSAVYWVKNYDIDGFRHDAVKHIPTEFWRDLNIKLKNQLLLKQDRKLYQIGETYGGYDLINSYINNGMLDAQFEFTIYQNLVQTLLNNVSFNYLKEALDQSMYYFGSHNVMGIISGNHDKARVISYADGSLRFDEDTQVAGYERHITNQGKIGYQKVAQIMSFIMTVPGIPVVYYGDEMGMPGGNDPDCRRMMIFDNYNPDQTWLRDTTAKLVNLRKNNMALMYGDTKLLNTDDNSLSFMRNYFGNIALYVMNKSPEEKKITLTLPEGFDYSQLKSQFGNSFKIENNSLQITLPSNSFELILQ